MDAPDAKKLIALAKACRRAGISEFEGFGFKFSLAPESPKEKAVKAKKATSNEIQDPLDSSFNSEGLSEEDKLFWSVGGGIPAENDS